MHCPGNLPGRASLAFEARLFVATSIVTTVIHKCLLSCRGLEDEDLLENDILKPQLPQTIDKMWLGLLTT